MLYDLDSPVEPRMERSYTRERDSPVGQFSSGSQRSKSRRRLGGLMSKDSKNAASREKALPLDDTHTGGDKHVASKEFLRVMRVLIFLGPRRGKSTTVGDGRTKSGFTPRSELDVSGHSFRRGIKSEVRRIKSVQNLSVDETQAVQSNQALRAAYRSPTKNDASGEGYGFWDVDDDKSSPRTPPSCYDSSSSASTMPASPPGSPPRNAAPGALPPRRPPSRTHSCPSLKAVSPSSQATMRNGGRKVWTNELCGEYTIREVGSDGSFVVNNAH